MPDLYPSQRPLSHSGGGYGSMVFWPWPCPNLNDVPTPWSSDLSWWISDSGDMPPYAGEMQVKCRYHGLPLHQYAPAKTQGNNHPSFHHSLQQAGPTIKGDHDREE